MLDKQILDLQKIVGAFLYYGRGVNPTIIHTMNDIALVQTEATIEQVQAAKYLLDYLTTHPDAAIRYLGSKMILHIHSNASYLTATKAQLRAGGHFFLSPNKKKNAPYNGPIHSLVKIIKNVVLSAAEAELGGLFLNAQETMTICNTLEELGHPQPATPTHTDNTTAKGIIHGTCKPQKTKAMDMQYHWLKDRQTQNHFDFYWEPGKTNLGDVYTKHYPPKYHRTLRPYILMNTNKDLTDRHLQGCVDSLIPSVTHGCKKDASGVNQLSANNK